MTDTSVEAAIGLLDAQDAAPVEEKAPKTDTNTDTGAASAAGDELPADESAAEAQGEPEGASPEGEDGEKPEPETPAIEPPEFWSADAKARFAELPADLQQVVLDQAKLGASATGKALQEAADRRKAADAELQNVTQVAQALKEWLPQAVETFKSRWDDVDWAKWAQDDPQAAFQGKIQFEAERDQLQRVQTAKQQADAAARQQLVAAEAERLKVLAPALADPTEGPKRRQELASYLEQQGVARDQIVDLSAVAVSLAHKAMLYDKAQAGLKNAKPPQRQPAGTTVKPSAAPAGSSSERATAAVTQRFRKSGSIDDAVALLNSRTP